MKLTKEQQAILDGKQGETLAKVIYADGFLRSCENLTSVHLPDIGRDHPLQEIGSGFSGCKSLETITIDGQTLWIN